MNKFKKEVILYGLAIGLNRGSMLIFMPPIVSMLGVSQYGLYTYIIALVYIISPFLSLNSSAGVVREGALDIKKAIYLERKIVPFIIILSVALAIVLEGINHFYSFGTLMGLTILLACSEALNNILFAHFRAEEKHVKYFIFSLLKVVLFLLMIYGMNYIRILDLRNIILAQLLLNLILYCLFSFKTLFMREYTKIPLKGILIFSSLLLPHTLAQWSMNAFNRLIIKDFIGEKELGIFSIAFSIASVSMIINSGIALVIPQHMIKNYKKWTTHKHIFRFYVYYSLLFVVIYTGLLFGIFIDRKFFHLVKYYDKNVVLYMTYMFGGNYFLGFYYYYSNILFYFKKSKELSKVTVLTSIVSVVITVILTYYLSTLGAAIGSLLTYVFYYLFIYYAAIKQEEHIKGNFIRYMLICTMSTILIFIIYSLFINFIF